MRKRLLRLQEWRNGHHYSVELGRSIRVVMGLCSEQRHYREEKIARSDGKVGVESLAPARSRLASAPPSL